MMLCGREGNRAGLAESNGSLPPIVTCGLTACRTPGSAPGPTLGMESLYLFLRLGKWQWFNDGVRDYSVTTR